MSNYFLCDQCGRKLADAPNNTAFCIAKYCGTIPVPKLVMYEHYCKCGKCGKRYDDPTDVCGHYRPRSEP